jgi:glucokinase
LQLLPGEVFMSIQLAGDVGGTKTALAIIDSELGPRNFLEQATFPSGDYPSLEALVLDFLKGKKWQLARASIDVAGPVVNGRCQTTNLPWVIDELSLSKELGIPVRLVNDLDAVAHAIPLLESGDLETLSPGAPVKHGALAVIAPGTGLGEGFLTWNGSDYRPYPSEGGHTDFAPSGPMQLKLLNYLMDRFGHVSYERVCSGLGVPNLYAFIKESGICPERSACGGARPGAGDWTGGPGRQGRDRGDRAEPVRIDFGQRGRQPGAESAGDGRGIFRRRHPAAHHPFPKESGVLSFVPK